MAASKTRRLFLKNLAALSTVGAVGISPDLPVLGGGALSADELAKCNEVARCSHTIRYLDERGAAYEACAKYPGWYQARWSDPALSDDPIRWACSVEDDDFDQIYARCFRAKVEGIQNF